LNCQAFGTLSLTQKKSRASDDRNQRHSKWLRSAEHRISFQSNETLQKIMNNMGYIRVCIFHHE
jgi:gamma-glutamyl-gamma-aminobutyrate hydrolase PuuD